MSTAGTPMRIKKKAKVQYRPNVTLAGASKADLRAVVAGSLREYLSRGGKVTTLPGPMDDRGCFDGSRARSPR